MEGSSRVQQGRKKGSRVQHGKDRRRRWRRRVREGGEEEEGGVEWRRWRG